MRSVVKTIAHLFGYEKDPGSPSNSEDDDDWGDENPRITMIKEQLEYYFSGMNLEKDKNFRDEIAQSEDGSVSVDYFLNCNRIKYLEATPEEILQAGHESQYLESDNIDQSIRSKEPFVHDANRFKRILKVSGLGKKVPQYAQYEFFNSIFPGEVVYVYLSRKESNGELEYTNQSLVEFTTAERVADLLDKGIVYGNSLLDVKPYYGPTNNNKNRRKRQQKQEEEESEEEPESQSQSQQQDEEEDEIELRPERDASDEVEPEQEVEPEPEPVQEEPEASKKRGPKKRGPKGRASKPRASK